LGTDSAPEADRAHPGFAVTLASGKPGFGVSLAEARCRSAAEARLPRPCEGMGQPGASQECRGSVYNGPVIDAHTDPMLGIDDQVGAEKHRRRRTASW